MALSQKLVVRQTQALIMTPQLVQSIKLLQLSSLDLAAYVDAEIERNPLLEHAGEDEAAPSDNPEVRGADDFAEDEAIDWISEELETGRASIEQGLSAGLENVFPDDACEKATAPETASRDYSQWVGAGTRAIAESSYDLEAYVCAAPTLPVHLAEQMRLAISDPGQRMIGQYLINMVDEAGYVTSDLAGVADKLGAAASDVEAVLVVLQTFDPPGICARNLSECLANQLKERNRFDPAMQALMSHLGLLAKRDFASLRRICGVNDEDLLEMVDEVRKLNPKPGLAFGSAPLGSIIPDILVRAAPNGTWEVELNSDTLPKVLINQRYYTEVAQNTCNDKDRRYIGDCFQSASWLVRALDQRAMTILKVSKEIVRQQEGFFVKGVQHLRPLNLKTIAEKIGMHESTVSRVTNDKYMATSRGVFELKYFFNPSIAAADGGEAHSAEAVRHRIRQLINGEDNGDVLSDDTIVEKLRNAGIEIARRTVTKYRETMRIPSSVQRRREKRVAYYQLFIKRES